MGLAFIPLYIGFMGVESYGLIGIFATIQGVIVIFDIGINATLTREMARLSAHPGSEQEMRNLVRSLELIYWGMAVLIGIVIIIISPFIAHHWVKAGQLAPHTIEQALRIMGLAMALQWPASFYTGGLIGLQKQVLLNIINACISTFRGVGAVLVLWLIAPTIQAFFSWQIIISIINTFVLAFFLWRRLSRTGKKAVFKKQLLTGVWRFAAEMSGIGILATILTQLDKIILSKMLTLEMFGYYTLAGVIAMSLYRLIGPVFTAIYPILTQLVSLSDREGLKQLYHKSCQFMSVLILPVTVVIALFSYEILYIWTQDPVTAGETHVLVSFLICGTAFSGLMNIPYALQLAHGWTRPGLYINLISTILIVPLIIFLTGRYGAIGGASAWVILNCGCFLIAIPIIHHRLLPRENCRWYWQDVFLPLAACLSTSGLGRLFMGDQMSQLATIVYLSAVSFITLAVTALSTPTTRAWLIKNVSRIKPAKKKEHWK